MIQSDKGILGVLRGAALIAVLVGAVGAVGLTLHAGRRNASGILVSLFVIWVLSPFIALVLADAVSKRWSILTRATVYTLMLLIAPASLAVYGNVALGSPRAKPAFAFLVVPLASWLLIAIALPAAALISAKLSHARGPI